MRGNKEQSTRLYYIDNLKIYLTILVILHHNAIAYSGSGPWSILDPGADEISFLLFTIFTTVNQAYFMGAFFLLAGYFTPRSLEKKGAKAFLIDRLIRLGIPILVYTTIIVNINGFILDSFVYSAPFRIRIGFNVGHLWFLQALLILSLIYVVWKAVSGRTAAKSPSWTYRGKFPPDVVLLVSVILLGMVTFGVRLIFPVGDWHLGIQPGHFAQYIFSFFVGILAYQGDWFDQLSRAQARRWGYAVIFMFMILFPMIVFGGVLEGGENLAKFEGGPYWQALAYSLWESAMLVGMVVFLISFFRERVNKASKLTQFLAPNAYTVYIIHQTGLYILQAVGLRIDQPAILKFIIVSLIAIPLCFFLSDLIPRIPYAKRVLG